MVKRIPNILFGICNALFRMYHQSILLNGKHNLLYPLLVIFETLLEFRYKQQMRPPVIEIQSHVNSP